MTTKTIDFFGSVTFIEIYIIHFNFSLPFLWKNCHNFDTILSFEHLNAHFIFIFNTRSNW